MANEKFCLRWNDFESNISSAFRELRDDKDFFDVTLACDDDQIQAHKLILSACSPFFRHVFRRNPHQHPLLYLKNVKYTDLQAVLNFMYHGEVNVAQEELNSFLTVAEDLRVKGLTQNSGETNSTPSSAFRSTKEIPVLKPPDRDPPPPPKRPRPAQPIHQPQEDDIQEVVPIKSEPRDTTDQNNTSTTQPHHAPMYNPPQPVALADEHDSMVPYQDEEEAYEEYGQYDEQYVEQQGGVAINAAHGQQGADVGKGRNFQFPEELLQFVAKSVEGNTFECTLCSNFKAVRKGLVRNHVESIHFPGVFLYSCLLCNREFQGKNALAVHKSAVHPNKPKLI